MKPHTKKEREWLDRLTYDGDDAHRWPNQPSYNFSNSQNKYELVIDHKAHAFRGFFCSRFDYLNRHDERVLTERECRLLAMEVFPFLRIPDDYEYDYYDEGDFL